jgi:hypothetical protein
LTWFLGKWESFCWKSSASNGGEWCQIFYWTLADFYQAWFAFTSIPFQEEHL